MRRTLAGSMLVGVLAALALFAAPASAQDQPRLVTIAARSCPTYEDITANRARNNIMESLKDLGPDTPYGQNGLPLLVDPAVEAQVQPNCTSIDNWAFTLGKGIATRDAVPPEPWGRLSYVTDPFSPVITTQASVPLRDSHGQPTNSTIYGATTITLTDEQRKLASQGSKLWIQGGTRADPITDPVTYGFGALRCATDNLNGDNVEWISYPPDTTHVFCFAYYVKPAPTSGTITVRKQVSLPPDTPAQKIRFTGNISYANNEFFLTSSNSKTDQLSFIRAGGSTWDFTEEVPALAKLTDIVCTSKLGSVATSDTATGRTSVALKPGDDVVCTYKNTFRRPPSGLTLRKVSTGGTGEFGFDIEGEGNTIPNAFARTVEPGLSTLVQPADEIADLPTGTYTVKETTPPDIGGTWALDHVDCLPDVAKQDREGDKVSIIVVRGPGTVCTFYNRFTPAGRITLRKITLGGTGTTRFQVRPLFGESRPEREQVATTTEEGVPVASTRSRSARTRSWRRSAARTGGRPPPSSATASPSHPSRGSSSSSSRTRIRNAIAR